VAVLAAAPRAHASWPGANGRVIYANSSALVTARPDGSDERAITPPKQPFSSGASEGSPSADGRRVIYLGPDDGIWVVGADGSNNHRILSPPDQSASSYDQWEWPQFSPDGRHITVTRNLDFGSEIWIANADGSQARMFYATHRYGNQRSEFSPDGRSIAFFNYRSSRAVLPLPGQHGSNCVGIYARRLAGGRPKLLFGGHGKIRGVSKSVACRYNPSGYGFDWSPNGKALTFSGAISGHGGDVKSTVITARTGSRKPSKRLGPASDTNFFPVYSPDGKSVAWTQLGTQLHPTFIAPVRGGHYRQLGRYGIDAWAPKEK
jgi:Tol biopolymer transport system component